MHKPLWLCGLQAIERDCDASALDPAKFELFVSGIGYSTRGPNRQLGVIDGKQCDARSSGHTDKAFFSPSAPRSNA